MNRTFRDAYEKELDNYVQMKSSTSTYLNRRARSVQECVVHIFSCPWLRNTFRAVVIY